MFQRKPRPVLPFADRVQRDLARVWVALIVILILLACNITLNGVRTVKEDHGITRLQIEKEALLRERAELMARKR